MYRFRIGQKVVCVDASGLDYYARVYKENNPVVNETYTIRGLNGIYDAVLLKEVRNAKRQWEGYYGEPVFKSCRFRPIVSISKKSERSKIISKLLSDGLNQPVEVSHA